MREGRRRGNFWEVAQVEQNVTKLLVYLEAIGDCLHQAYLGAVECDWERVGEALVGIQVVAEDALTDEDERVIKLRGRGKRGS
ncbi:MAG TPA: hypothetical protein GXX28_00985 [Firmicutes bacterium]|nr:hypothetical protein [Bacillota bacterium]